MRAYVIAPTITATTTKTATNMGLRMDRSDSHMPEPVDAADVLGRRESMLAIR